MKFNNIFSAGADEVDTTNRSGIENVIIEDTTTAAGGTDNDVTLANGEALTLDNFEAGADGDDVSLSTTNADETVTLNDVGADDNNIDLDLTGSNEDVTTLNLVAASNASAIRLVDTDNELETLNLSGDADLEVTNNAITSLTTVDASGMEAPEGGDSPASVTV